MGEGVTTGGIGSKMLRRRAPPEVEQETHVPDVIASPSTPVTADFDAGQTESWHAKRSAPKAAAVQSSPMAQDDVAPPFPIIDIDDWTFQRAETAAFKKALRESAIPRSDEVEDEVATLSQFRRIA
jgi:hypothetical protein